MENKPITVLWDKIDIQGHVYSIAISPQTKAVFLFRSSKYLTTSFFHRARLMTDWQWKSICFLRDRTIHDGIDQEVLLDIITKEGLYIPDENVVYLYIPLRLLKGSELYAYYRPKSD